MPTSIDELPVPPPPDNRTAEQRIIDTLAEQGELKQAVTQRELLSLLRTGALPAPAKIPRSSMVQWAPHVVLDTLDLAHAYALSALVRRKVVAERACSAGVAHYYLLTD